MSKELNTSIQDIEWINLQVSTLVRMFRDARFEKKLAPIDYADYGNLIARYARLLETAGEEVRHDGLMMGGIEEEEDKK